MATFINPPGPQPEPATYLDRGALAAAAPSAVTDLGVRG